MKLLEDMMSWKPPNLRSAVYPVHSTVYQLASSVYFIVVFVVQIFSILNNFRLVAAEVFLTIKGVFRSIRETYMLLSNILAPLAIVGRFLITITQLTHNMRRRRQGLYTY